MTTAPVSTTGPDASSVASETSQYAIAKNASTLLAGQAVGLIVPLLTVPYLARVLGPTSWGPVLAAQALGNWMLLVLEYGFELSGTRAVARARATPDTMSEVVHGVQSAKTLLALVALPLAVIALFGIPGLRSNLSLLGWTLAFAILRGFSPLWFFQGIERVHRAVAIDAVTRAAAALGVFVVVHGPDDSWRVLALQAVFAAVALAVLTFHLSTHVRLRLPAANVGIATLRSSSSIFACRAWTGLYIQGNTLILSALAGPAVVGFFGGAERIVRAAINLLAPLTQAFFPRVSYLHSVDPRAAQRVIRQALVGVGLLGVFMGVCAFFGAPLLVQVLLGSQYSAAIPVLRVMGLLPVLVAVNTVLGLYWALPFGRDRSFLISIVAAGITNVVAAFVLVPRWGAIGMATSAVLAEVVVFVFLITAYTAYTRSAR